ncbi:MAG TPA: DUF1963 domain-containing protein [Polyangia bacterium]
MRSATFRKLLAKRARHSRELELESGDPGPLPVTKVSGVPWWPRGRRRPRCRLRHPMSFVLQVGGPDIDHRLMRESLVSFHYCQECALLGRMAWGWRDDQRSGYDVSVFNVFENRPDGLGLVAQPMFAPSKGTVARRLEVPLPEDAGIRWEQLPEDYPAGADDFDERIYPGVIHVPRSKIGGWPTWVQSPAWPPGGKSRWHFLGQLDSRIGTAATWAAGGYAYLFFRKDEAGEWEGELSIQTT